MVCDDCFETDECGCGPGEMCGLCFESRVKPEDVPKILALVSEPEEEAHDFSSPSHCKACMKAWIGRGMAAMEDEPPLTPEEEEEVAEDSSCTCADAGDCFAPAGHYADCPEAPKVEEPPPPQPERRPPFLVAYSVSGHLYEVALSGDASVHAVDGALIIEHALGPIAGIVSVLPFINKET